MSSSIDITKPVNNSLLVSQEVRTLAIAAKAEIEALQAQIGNGVGQGVSYFLTSTLSDTGTYDVMSRSPDAAAEVVESVIVNASTGTIDEYIAEALARTEIPAGEWSYDFFLYTSLATATTYVTLSLYKRASGGAETLLFSVNSPDIDNTVVANYNIKTVQQAFTVLTTDRLVLKVTATTNHTSNVTVSLVHSGTSHYSHIVTPLAVETSQSIGTLIAGSSAKTTPVGADTIAISDSADGDKLKKFSFTNLNAYFATVAPVVSVNALTGAVVLTTNNVADSSNKRYVTEAQLTLLGNTSGTNSGDNAINSLYSGLVSNATHTGDATGATALTVVKINGTLMSGLATGILKNTTGTGVPSIAVAGDFPTLNQNTTGTADAANALKSATTTVNISSATAPTSGQILTATSGTAATWQTAVAAPRSAVTKTADYSLLVGDDRKIIVISGDSIDITLPASATLTAGWSVTLVNENAFVSQSDSATIHTTTAANTPIGKKNVLVSRAGSDLLNGASTQYHGVALIVPPKECVDLVFTSSGNFTAYPSTTVGWKDIPQVPQPLGANPVDPTESLIDASFMRAFEFTDATASNEKEIYYNVHINHDYVMGTRVYPHVHWLCGNTTATTIIGWSWLYSVAKGHAQQAFNPTGTRISKGTTLVGTAYEHYVSEVSDADAIPATNLEPDSVIQLKLIRDSANVYGTGDNSTVSAWLIFVDAHYLSTEGGTPLKAPPFFL